MPNTSCIAITTTTAKTLESIYRQTCVRFTSSKRGTSSRFRKVDGTRLPSIWQLVRPQVKPSSQDEAHGSIRELNVAPGSFVASRVLRLGLTSSAPCRLPNAEQFRLDRVKLSTQCKLADKVDQAKIPMNQTVELLWNEVLLLRNNLDLDENKLRAELIEEGSPPAD
jgi:hypothetical protein